MKKYTLLCLVVLAACAVDKPLPTYNNELQFWVGRPAYRLYQSWGRPAHVFYVSPQETVVTYVTTAATGENNPYGKQLYYQGMGNDDSWLEKMFGPPESNQPKIYYCKTSFIIQNGIVAGFNFNGDDCVANN